MTDTTAALVDVYVLVKRFEDGETDILDVTTEDPAGRVAELEAEAEEAELISPASFEIQTWPVQVPGTSPAGWNEADLRTLIVTAGEIAMTYGTGTDGLDRDDVLSTRQRAVLAKASRSYLAEMGDAEEPSLLSLARKFRDAPGQVTQDEYGELREAGLVSADGVLNVAGSELEPYLDEFC